MNNVLGLDDLAQKVLNCRILVVDDGASNRALVGNYLKLSGFTDMEFAADGHEALAMVESYDPDILILDIAMPGVDGFEVCRQITKQARGQRLPILMQTAFGGPKERAQAFEVGATDFVTKPIHRAELIARVRLHLENRLLIRSLRDYHDRVGAELTLAQSMQESLLPSPSYLEELERGTGIQVAAHFANSSELGGDFWGLQKLSDSRVGVFVVDFSGHGVTAALNTFRLHTLIGSSSLSDPAALLDELNQRLVGLLPRGNFATIFAALVDLDTDTLTYAAASAPSPVAVIPGQPPLHLDGSGVPLGFTRSSRYANRTCPFPAGSRLFLYSDALIETPDQDKALWGDKILAKLLAPACGDASADITLDRVVKVFYDSHPGPVPDDLTAVVLRRQH